MGPDPPGPTGRSRTPATPPAPPRPARRRPTAAAPAGPPGWNRWTTPRVSKPPPRRTRRAPPAAPRPPNHHRDVAEQVRDGRLRLVHEHFDGVYPLVVHHLVGDLTADRFDQVARWPGHDIGRQLCQRGVVVRVSQIVTGRGVGEVDPHGDVDDEVLSLGALVV